MSLVLVVFITFAAWGVEAVEGATDAEVCLEIASADMPIEDEISVAIFSRDDSAIGM